MLTNLVAQAAGGGSLPTEAIGLGLGGAILLVLVPALLRQYAKAQAGVWEIVRDKEAERDRESTRADKVELERDLWRDRAYMAGWTPNSEGR